MPADQTSNQTSRAPHFGPGETHSVFKEKAADYTASRPDYPAAFFETLKTICPPQEDTTVADIGSGTGILTEALLRSGYRVTAIEPNTEMRQMSDLRLGQLPGYRSLAGSAENTSLPSASVHLITAAQAFHWFDIARARTEFLRVLTPNGQVALIWNDRLPDDPLHVALNEIFKECGGDKRNALLTREDNSDVPRFFGSTTPQQFTWPHAHHLEREGLLSLAFSRSYFPGRQTPAGLAATDRLSQIFDRLATNGTVTVPYRTTAFIGRPK